MYSRSQLHQQNTENCIHNCVDTVLLFSLCLIPYFCDGMIFEVFWKKKELNWMSNASVDCNRAVTGGTGGEETCTLSL